MREGELVGEGQGPLQPDGRVSAMLGKRVQNVESSLHPGGAAPERLRNETMGQKDHGRQQQRGAGRRQGGAGRGDRAMASGVCQD